MTENVRTFITILLTILCLSDLEEESNFKLPLTHFFMHFLQFTKQKALSFMYLCLLE